jgi:ABC-type transporter Mla maintaining outer membrane lipid asymmetry ATPase subunit MlaF
MKITRFTINNRTIEIPPLTPAIFPLAGENGSGKTFLLQTIYAIFNQLAIPMQDGETVDCHLIENPSISIGVTAPHENRLSPDNAWLLLPPGEPLIYPGAFKNTMAWLRPDDYPSGRGAAHRDSLKRWLELPPSDSIILLDSPTDGLHPDWQYRLPHDLSQWRPDCQFIVATHSVDFCEALTPAHVLYLESRHASIRP